MIENVRVSYIGTALPTGANTVNVFSTVVSFPFGNGLQALGIHRINMTFQNDQAGTLKYYRSSDRGTNWTQVGSTSVALAAANTENSVDVLVEPYQDFKIDWLNGGVDQTKFAPQISLIGERSLAF